MKITAWLCLAAVWAAVALVAALGYPPGGNILIATVATAAIYHCGKETFP